MRGQNHGPPRKLLNELPKLIARAGEDRQRIGIQNCCRAAQQRGFNFLACFRPNPCPRTDTHGVLAPIGQQLRQRLIRQHHRRYMRGVHDQGLTAARQRHKAGASSQCSFRGQSGRTRLQRPA